MLGVSGRARVVAGRGPDGGRAVKWTVEKVGVPACGVGFSSQPLDGPVGVSPADHGPEKR